MVNKLYANALPLKIFQSQAENFSKMGVIFLVCEKRSKADHSSPGSIRSSVNPVMFEMISSSSALTSEVSELSVAR